MGVHHNPKLQERSSDIIATTKHPFINLKQPMIADVFKLKKDAWLSWYRLGISMRYLILVLVLLSCNSTAVNPKYTTVEGTWTTNNGPDYVVTFTLAPCPTCPDKGLHVTGGSYHKANVSFTVLGSDVSVDPVKPSLVLLNEDPYPYHCGVLIYIDSVSTDFKSIYSNKRDNGCGGLYVGPETGLMVYTRVK